MNGYNINPRIQIGSNVRLATAQEISLSDILITTESSSSSDALSHNDTERISKNESSPDGRSDAENALLNEDWLTTVIRFMPVHERIDLAVVNKTFHNAVCNNRYLKEDYDKIVAVRLMKNAFQALHEKTLESRAQVLMERFRERAAQRLFRQLQQQAEIREQRRLKAEGYATAIRMAERKRLLGDGFRLWSTPKNRVRLMTNVMKTLKKNARHSLVTDEERSNGSRKSSKVYIDSRRNSRTYSNKCESSSIYSNVCEPSASSGERQ